jgi:hypothetical protein
MEKFEETTEIYMWLLHPIEPAIFSWPLFIQIN